MTQGIADVNKPGTGVKAALTWQTNDKRVRVIASEAWYDYSLPDGVASIGNGDT
jgi:hypothetical protein